MRKMHFLVLRFVIDHHAQQHFMKRCGTRGAVIVYTDRIEPVTGMNDNYLVQSHTAVCNKLNSILLPLRFKVN